MKHLKNKFPKVYEPIFRDIFLYRNNFQSSLKSGDDARIYIVSLLNLSTDSCPIPVIYYEIFCFLENEAIFNSILIDVPYFIKTIKQNIDEIGAKLNRYPEITEKMNCISNRIDLYNR
jgi:hypothetical protein